MCVWGGGGAYASGAPPPPPLATGLLYVSTRPDSAWREAHIPKLPHLHVLWPGSLIRNKEHTAVLQLLCDSAHVSNGTSFILVFIFGAALMFREIITEGPVCEPRKGVESPRSKPLLYWVSFMAYPGMLLYLSVYC